MQDETADLAKRFQLKDFVEKPDFKEIYENIDDLITSFPLNFRQMAEEDVNNKNQSFFPT